MAIHYGVEVNKGDQGQSFLKWLGGYFEPGWSVNPFWTPEFKDLPSHEVTRGVKPFKINDEWYYHMRFVEGMKGVTPILSAVAPLTTITSRWKEGQKAQGARRPDHHLLGRHAGRDRLPAPGGRGRALAAPGLRAVPGPARRQLPPQPRVPLPPQGHRRRPAQPRAHRPLRQPAQPR